MEYWTAPGSPQRIAANSLLVKLQRNKSTAGTKSDAVKYMSNRKAHRFFMVKVYLITDAEVSKV